MYLKEINTIGFKSFADRINIKLDDRITCIVGPNGSGKSNVVDAVRWVLGEQSVKSLRGDGNMSDVIFSGSKSRNPLNVASVELIFDNTDNYLNLNFTEVSIKRKAYRSGENEYFINGERCRLKDIVNLLLDTGIGKESFNIISQGEVDKILSNSSNDRRLIIEEAAGITKYKKRKEEAIKRLDRTHDNLDRVNDIVHELEIQVEPLREQSLKANEYLENKKNLESIEVALLAYDIYSFSEEKKLLNERLDQINNKIIEISSESNNSDILILEENKKLDELQKSLSNENNRLLKIVEEVEKINSERLLLKEKNKSLGNKSEAEEEYRYLLNQIAKIKADIIKTEEEIKSIRQLIDNNKDVLKNIDNKRSSLKQKKNMLTGNYSSIDQELVRIKFQKEALKNELDNMAFIPNSVRKILNEKNLIGIHNTIGNIIEVDDNFAKALDIALSSSKNFIITENEDASKKAINYLKNNHLGRATFFPLDVINERYVDKASLAMIKEDNDFIAVLSDVVRCNKLYENIVKNQLGQVILSPDIDSANRISRKINRRYKVVTIDGDVINVGGSMSGGSTNSNTKSAVSLKQEIHFLEERENNKKKEQLETDIEIGQVDTDLRECDEEYFKVNLNINSLEEKIKGQNSIYNELKNALNNIEAEVSSLKSLVSDNLDIREEELLNIYYEKNNLKEKTTENIKMLNLKISELKDRIDSLNASYKLKNSEVRNLEKESGELSIRLSKIDTKMDSMLLVLNEEYSLTFDKAFSDYKLEIEVDEAREKVSLYKNNIKKIGMVNLEAIEEYEKVNTRYEFLCSQKDDLLIAENSLIEIMNEMDEVIEEEFEKTYNKVDEEFSKVFKELFGGGSAKLSLNNPNNMLTTGLDIIASPPGKKLSSISLLSGGEKTLTAISLLFAILNIRKVPFCLFDEVEAALDEANVETFGKYLNNYRNKTQFLIITHKKKTMEYADTLYGITMQESGVSKLVSVKLNEHIDTL